MSLANKLGRLILRQALKLIFAMRYQRRHGKVCLEKYRGLALLIPPEVFNPALFGSSYFLADYLLKHPPASGTRAFDLGCGSGLLGLQLAKLGAQVIGSDINPQAVWAANINAQLNGY